jgi:glycine dehydrogenase subunit 2
MSGRPKLRPYHAPVWSEPVIMEMGRSGRRGLLFPKVEEAVRREVGEAEALIPASMRRKDAPALPELSEPEVLHHYTRLSQQTLGMIGTSLFGTCTMKYNAAVNEKLAALPELASLHPYQPPETLQGVLEILHRFDLICASSPAWTDSCSRPGAERMPPICMPASPAPITRRVASSSSAAR